MNNIERMEKIKTLVEFALNNSVDYIYILEDVLRLINGENIDVTNERLESYIDY